MSQPAVHPLAEIVHNEEKIFLMQHYARLLIEQTQADEQLRENIVESLLIARSYADHELASRIADLLRTHGHEEELKDFPLEEEGNDNIPSLAELGNSLSEEGETEAIGLFEDEEDEGAADEEEDLEDLFAVDSESFGGQRDTTDYVDDEDHGEAIFVANEDEFEEEEDSSLFPEEDEDLEDRSTEENIFADEGEEITNRDIGKEDQDAGVLFNEDIYSENKGETKRKSHEQEDTPGFEAPDVEAKESKIGKRKKGEVRGEKGKREALERMAKAKEELERPKKVRKAELQAKEEDKDSEADESNTADLLAKITYQVSLDDLEKKLGIQVIPEDRIRLDRQLAKKMNEPTIRALLEGAEKEGVTLAILPRLPRCIRAGQLFKVTGANMVRGYPQFFDNVQQVVLKLRTESFFLQESPELDWAIFTCEVLPSSRKKNYMQQKQVLKQHAERYQSNELRVRRRNLIETIYDLIIIKLVHDQNLLSETVDLTESKIGRQNLAFINFGEDGIRISDIARQQTHAQLGVCPSW